MWLGKGFVGSPSFSIESPHKPLNMKRTAPPGDATSGGTAIFSIAAGKRVCASAPASLGAAAVAAATPSDAPAAAATAVLGGASAAASYPSATAITKTTHEATERSLKPKSVIAKVLLGLPEAVRSDWKCFRDHADYTNDACLRHGVYTYAGYDMIKTWNMCPTAAYECCSALVAVFSSAQAYCRTVESVFSEAVTFFDSALDLARKALAETPRCLMAPRRFRALDGGAVGWGMWGEGDGKRSKTTGANRMVVCAIGVKTGELSLRMWDEKDTSIYKVVEVARPVLAVLRRNMVVGCELVEAKKHWKLHDLFSCWPSWYHPDKIVLAEMEAGKGSSGSSGGGSSEEIDSYDVDKDASVEEEDDDEEDEEDDDDEEDDEEDGEEDEEEDEEGDD